VHAFFRASVPFVNARGDFVLPLMNAMEFSCDDVMSISTFDA